MMSRMSSAVAAVVGTFGVASMGFGATVFGPSPYLSVNDSPLAGLATFVNETFEDGQLNALGLSVSSGVVTQPSAATDSVDADDGAIDGAGSLGRSLLSTTSTSIDVDINPGSGVFATYAGLVVTDVGAVIGGPQGFSQVTVQAFDLLGELAATAGPFQFGDGDITGATAEDRFVGFFNAAGISRLRVTVASSTDWEVDHIQWGVPSPSVGAAMLLAAGGTMLRRRRV